MYPDLNRYCNIVPFESHRVKLSIDAASSWAKDHGPFEAQEAPDPYVNATLLAFPPALDSHRYIMSMGPMHPDYHGSVYCRHTRRPCSAVQCAVCSVQCSASDGMHQFRPDSGAAGLGAVTLLGCIHAMRLPLCSRFCFCSTAYADIRSILMAFRIPHSAFRIPHSHSAFRIPHSTFHATVPTQPVNSGKWRGKVRRE